MKRSSDPWATASASAAGILRTLASPPPEQDVREAIRRTFHLYHYPAPRMLFLPSPVAAARFIAHMIALGAAGSVASAWAKGLSIEEGSEEDRTIRSYTGIFVRGEDDLQDTMRAATSVALRSADRQPVRSTLLLHPDTTALTTEILRLSETARCPARSFIRRYHSHFLHAYGGRAEALAPPADALQFAYERYALGGATRSILRLHGSFSWAHMPTLLQLDQIARSGDLTADAMRYIRDLRTILTGCFCFVELRNILLVVRPPVCSVFDAAGRLHSEGGPALEFADGAAFWALEDIAVDPRLFDPETVIPPAEIEAIPNPHLRRLLIERYDGLRGADAWERWLDRIGAEVIDSDPLHGDLFIVPGRSELSFLRVRCPSKGDIHHLSIPQEIVSAREARAWTFNVAPELLDAAVET